MTKLGQVLDTHRRNSRFIGYDLDTVMVPFDRATDIVTAFHQQNATINADRHLTGDGKDAARIKAGNETLRAIKAWHEPRLRGIDADLLEQRAALLPTTDRPDPRRVEMMALQLLKHTPQDVAVFYNAASEDERRVMEAASASTGRVPMKSANGLEWKPLLDPEMVNEGIMARAAATNPVAAAKVQELTEIRAMQVTIAGVAASEIRNVLSEFTLDA